MHDLYCPDCGLILERHRLRQLSPQHCPRCLARMRRLVPLLALDRMPVAHAEAIADHGGARAPARRESLARANATRLAIAEVRAQIKAGSLTVRAAIEDARARPMTTFQLLTAQRLWGPHRAAAGLLAIDVPERKRIAELTPRQRELLVGLAEHRDREALKV
jgi:hypothetical protein